MKFGLLDVADLRYGGQPVVAAYLGGVQVWPSAGGKTLAGQLICTALLQGHVVVVRPLVGSSVAVSSLAGGMARNVTIAGSVVTVSTFAGDILVGRYAFLAGTLDAVSELTGAMDVDVPDATVAAAGTYVDDTDLTTYTSGSISIGAVGSRRFVAVLATGSGPNATNTGASCSVDGHALSFVVRGHNNSFNTAEIWFGAVPTANTTGIMSFNWNAGMSRSRFQLVACHNIISGTAIATDKHEANGDNNTALSAAVSAGGIGIGLCRVGEDLTFGWTGLTGYTKIGGTEVVRMSGAGAAFASSTTVSATPNVTGGAFSNFIALLATFR